MASMLKVCALAVIPEVISAVSLSLLQIRAKRAIEDTRTGSCADSHKGTSYFLGNEYIELGISPMADFGTRCPKPAGFFGASARSAIGMTAAYGGFGGDGPRIDYFMPGSPEERFGIGFKTGGADGKLTGGSNTQLVGKNDITITSMTLGTQSVEFQGNLFGKVQINGKYTLLPGDKHFTTEITLKNVASEKLFDVRYHRSFDPDNTKDAGGHYSTDNKIVARLDAGDTVTAVSATSSAGDAFFRATGQLSTIFFATADSRAVAYIGGFSNNYDLSYRVAAAFSSPKPKGYTHTGDEAIQITFGVGDMEVGASTNLRYVTSLNYVDTVSDIVTVAEAASDKSEGDVGAVTSAGDPHMINIKGDAFDIYRAGVWEFLRLPKDATVENSELSIVANVTHVGEETDKCTKALYITRFTLAGSWLKGSDIDVRVLDGKMHVSMGKHVLSTASKPRFVGGSPHGYLRLDMPKDDMLTIKVGSAMIAVGIDQQPVHSFLNMQAKGVSGLGRKLGGLLGEDDHSWVSMRPASCSDAHRKAHKASKVHFD